MAAFERARTAEADGIELDVRLDRDGTVVVFHDDDLRRLANRPERIAERAAVRTLPRECGVPAVAHA